MNTVPLEIKVPLKSHGEPGAPGICCSSSPIVLLCLMFFLSRSFQPSEKSSKTKVKILLSGISSRFLTASSLLLLSIPVKKISQAQRQDYEIHFGDNTCQLTNVFVRNFLSFWYATWDFGFCNVRKYFPCFDNCNR